MTGSTLRDYLLTHRMELKRKHLAVFITADEEKEVVTAMEEATVSLETKETTRQNNSEVVWIYGSEKPTTRIATLKNRKFRSDYGNHFRDRLQLDYQTWSLTIHQLRVNDSGVYMCQSIGTKVLSQHIHLVVYSSVRPPSIKVNASLMNTSCSSITVECYVENTKDLTLSLYRGRDRLESTSSAVLSSRLSLALEIKSHDGDDYSCVAENPVDKKATKIHTEDTCLRDREISSWCQTEASVRLVISAIVGMALIVLLVDHIRLRR